MGNLRKPLRRDVKVIRFKLLRGKLGIAWVRI
jgi:hypothetical protein